MVVSLSRNTNEDHRFQVGEDFIMGRPRINTVRKRIRAVRQDALRPKVKRNMSRANFLRTSINDEMRVVHVRIRRQFVVIF